MGANFVDPFREGRELEKGGRETRPTRGFHRAGMAAADDAYQLVIDAPDLPAHTCGHAVRRTRAVVRAASALGLIAVLGSLAGYYGGGSHRISELGSLSFGVIASLIPSGPSSVEVPLASLRARHPRSACHHAVCSQIYLRRRRRAPLRPTGVTRRDHPAWREARGRWAECGWKAAGSLSQAVHDLPLRERRAAAGPADLRDGESRPPWQVAPPTGHGESNRPGGGREAG